MLLVKAAIVCQALSFVFVNGQLPSQLPIYTTDLESELRTSLLTDYEVLQRPNETVTVYIAFNLITINSLNIKDQVLSTSGYFTMKWTDSRLKWSSNSNYDNVNSIFSNENYVWRPAVVVENSVDDLEIFSDENMLMRVISTGDVSWNPGGIFETSCDADVTFYPLDTQECSLILTTWAYTSSEVRLEFSSTPFILDNFNVNGEWEVLETTTSSETSTRAKDPSNSYSRLYFTLKLKRRPLFHIFNTLLPVMLMASLIVFVFKLPPESGERVGMSLTVLLAYAVYLTLISDNIPNTSLSASILSTYLTIILMLSTLSVVFTIVVLDIYFNHEDDDEPPAWLQSFTRIFLVRMSMWKGTSCCKRQTVSPGDRITEINISPPQEKLPITDLESEADENKLYKSKTINHQDVNTKEENGDMKTYSWKEVALILDRCFMYLFIFLTVVVTVICLAILTAN